MGATKALAERVIEARESSRTRFAAVRFGNVLGSSGSVLPIFQRQIAAGGPVTVTHPEMTRFFMTIPEAVQLVLEATGIAEGGDIFVLDMGEPVRILDLAHRMIELSGRQPGRDIRIDIIGIRPGERLHEELFNVDEQVRPTRYGKVMRATRPPLDPDQLRAGLDELQRRVVARDEQGLDDVLVVDPRGRQGAARATTNTGICRNTRARRLTRDDSRTHPSPSNRASGGCGAGTCPAACWQACIVPAPHHGGDCACVGRSGDGKLIFWCECGAHHVTAHS